ncbi:MAG TPA: hypothetical protein VJ757_04910 [Pseudonocardiaceae bacterium]|jgi:hypothetical protein|nr:hypothetical protein [Pseudonocardiaceae bacterium]
MLARAWNAAPRTGGVLVSKKITLEWDISAIKVEQYRWGLRFWAHGSTLIRDRTTAGKHPGDTDPQIGPAE